MHTVYEILWWVDTSNRRCQYVKVEVKIVALSLLIITTYFWLRERWLNMYLILVVIFFLGMGNRKLISVLTAFALLMTLVCMINSSILPTDSNQFGICIRNCAQCKKMFGAYFEGQLCADACVKFKGKVIPDCEDLDSISPFLNKMD